MNDRGRVGSLRWALAPSALLAVVLAAGCGGEKQTCIEGANELRRAERVTVPEAVGTQTGEPIQVRGALLVRRGDPVRLCTRLIDTEPFPTCQEPAFVIEGLGNPYRAIEGLQTPRRTLATQEEPAAGWAESLTMIGLVEDDTLHVPLSCQSRRVVEHFEERTDQELALDVFPGFAERGHLNFEALRDPAAVRARRREWGGFSIVVWPGKSTDALAEERAQLSPYILRDASQHDERGIVWLLLEDAGWVAVTDHGDGVLLEWTAGGGRRVDARWERLYSILEDLQ
jgi:hypothetical protein